MFDFAAVGGVVALVGIVFVTVVGWRLLPKARRQRNSRQELQDLSGYVAEAVVLESTGLLGSLYGNCIRWPKSMILRSLAWFAVVNVFRAQHVGSHCARVI
ncbi:MAG: hypothetical protein CM1200mP41_27060 [Gammaproteobacteria bacterium]|nr:MAG: hypothetical protein CM1200mP41_27060 [Gammaproteobacteria bacterium]